MTAPIVLYYFVFIRTCYAMLFTNFAKRAIFLEALFL